MEDGRSCDRGTRFSGVLVLGLLIPDGDIGSQSALISFTGYDSDGWDRVDKKGHFGYYNNSNHNNDKNSVPE